MDKKYYKIFVEFKFPVQVQLFDCKSKIMNSYWPKEFPHWELSGNNAIRFGKTKVIKDSGEIFVVEPKRLIYSVENPATDNYFQEKFKKYYKTFKVLAAPSSFFRIGVRGLFCIPGVEFEKTIKKANANHIFQKEFFDSIEKNYKMDDFSITLEQKNSRIIYGPMKKEQNHGYLNEFIDKTKIAKDFSFFDVDTFETNIKPKNAEKTFENLLNKTVSYPQNIQKYLGESK